MDEKQIIYETLLYGSEKDLPFIVLKNTGLQDVPYHMHDHIEILYVLSGCPRIVICGQEFCANAGDLCVINCGDAHYVSAGPWEIIVVQVKPAMLSARNAELFESESFTRFLQHKVEYTPFIPWREHTKHAQKYILDMYREYTDKNPGYALLIKGDLYKLFGWFARNNYIIFPSAGEISNENEMKKIQNVLTFIHENFPKKLNEKALAASCYMNYHHFCRTFKKASGMRFIDYLTYIRVCEAEKLLMQTNKSITQIAYETGFSSSSYFSSCFKKHKGISPSQIRKSKIIKI